MTLARQFEITLGKGLGGAPMTGIPKKAFWTYKGRSMSLQSWAVFLGVKYSVLKARMLTFRGPSMTGEQCFESAVKHIEGRTR